MIIKQLKKIIDGLPDDALVLTPDDDHSYKKAECFAETALVAFSDSNYIYEDYGDENKDNKKDKRILCLIVR